MVDGQAAIFKGKPALAMFSVRIQGKIVHMLCLTFLGEYKPKLTWPARSFMRAMRWVLKASAIAQGCLALLRHDF
jgi:hypothetical protein